MLITTYHDKDEKNLNLSEDKLVEISKEFMKNNDYCTIQNPKLVFTTKTEQDMNYDLGRINEKYLFFEDENDASKMFEVKIDDYTGDVMGFATSDSAKYDHERFSKAQK